VKRILSALTGGGFADVRAELRPDGWFEAPGLCRFGFPWPWHETADAGDLVDASGSRTDNEVIAALCAPRVHGSARLLLWRSSGSFQALLPTMAERVQRLYAGAYRGLRRVRVGGAPAVVVEVDLPTGDRVCRLVAADLGDHVWHAELRVPRSAADGYRAHFDTMLASWSWR
jgi:hypothetical protein